jgi:hypothetical protein
MIDLRSMVQDLSKRPTHVAELVSRQARIVGMCDASSTGVGAIWLMLGRCPLVWRIEWPAEIHRRYKAGAVMNSDLEQAGIILAMMALESTTNLWHTPTELYGDNSPSISWSTRLVSKSEAHLTHRLVRAMAKRCSRRCATGPTTTTNQQTLRPAPLTPPTGFSEKRIWSFSPCSTLCILHRSARGNCWKSTRFYAPG